MTPLQLINHRDSDVSYHTTVSLSQVELDQFQGALYELDFGYTLCISDTGVLNFKLHSSSYIPSPTGATPHARQLCAVARAKAAVATVTKVMPPYYAPCHWHWSTSLLDSAGNYILFTPWAVSAHWTTPNTHTQHCCAPKPAQYWCSKDRITEICCVLTAAKPHADGVT
jgi:hypothetical protein